MDTDRLHLKKLTMIANTRSTNDFNWNAVNPINEYIDTFLIFGGSLSMWTLNSASDIPANVKADPEWLKKMNVPTDSKLSEMAIHFNGKPVIFSWNVNDKAANQFTLMQRCISAGMKIKYVRVGNELYLSKFTKVGAGSKDTPGFIKVISPQMYCNLYHEISQLVKYHYPDIRLAFVGAPEKDASRIAWNNIVRPYMESALNRPDFVAIHIYRTSDSKDEDGYNDGLNTLNWNWPILFTEVAHKEANHNPEGIQRFKDLMTEVFDFCKERGDGSKPGFHVYGQTNSRPDNYYAALYSNSGITPLGTAAIEHFKYLYWDEPDEPKPVILTKVITTTGPRMWQWTQTLTWSDGTQTVRIKTKIFDSIRFVQSNEVGVLKKEDL